MHTHLGHYLNDHLAGSVAALELVAHLRSTQQSAGDQQSLDQLRSEIEADRDELLALMQRLEISESRPRQALAWLAEKISQWKLDLDDQQGGTFRWFEALEMLSLGIEGKRLLWTTLAIAAKDCSTLVDLDYDRLTQRARKQRERVDTYRENAVRQALRD